MTKSSRLKLYIMTTEALLKLHAARPFQPFVIRLGDGQALPVEHPGMLAYAPNNELPSSRADGSFEIIDLLLVTELDVRPPRATSRPRKIG